MLCLPTTLVPLAEVTGVQCPDILLGGNGYYSLYGTAFPGFMDSSVAPRFAPWVFSIVELILPSEYL